MSRYAGMSCIVCGKKFDDEDTSDIVVCPVCGLPHHRECYKQLGHCAMEDKHGTSEQWSSESVKAETAASDEDTIICPKCSHKNNKNNLFCDNCGYAFDSENKSEQNYDPDDLLKTINSLPDSEDDLPSPVKLMNILPKLDDKEIIDGISVRELKLFIGQSPYYFISRFRFFKKGRLNLSLNVPGYIGGFVYYFYRKMYLMGVIMFIITLVTSIPMLIYIMANPSAMFRNDSIYQNPILSSLPNSYLTRLERYSNIANRISFIVSVLNGSLFNILYKKHVYKSINAIKSKNLTVEEYESELAKKGGVSLLWGILSGVVMFVALMVISMLYL